MKTNKKQAVLSLLILGIFGILLYLVFRDSWPEIWGQLKRAEKSWLLLLFFLGNGYYILDGEAYYLTSRRNGSQVKRKDGILMAYMAVFFNIATLGAGTKPSQVFYLYEKDVKPGPAAGILTMQYVCYKITVVLYACLGLGCQWDYVNSHYEGLRQYLAFGFGISFLVVAVLIWVCASGQVHSLVLLPLKKHIHREVWVSRLEAAQEQLEELRRVVKSFSSHKGELVQVVVVNGLKMTCWYLIPFCACRALGQPMKGMSLVGALCLTSIMQLLIGVLPSTGGIGSTEAVYLFIYAGILGKTLCGATMVLYRFFTCYVPFLLSIFLVAAVGRKYAHREI